MSFYESTVLDQNTFSLLKRLGQPLAERGFVLVGGTALAIQFGHRKSIDLDFFSQEHFETDRLLAQVEDTISRESLVEVIGKAENTLNLIVDGIKVDLISYRYPRLAPPIQAGGYQMLQTDDIGPMKLSAVANRGTKKDFFDLYSLLQRQSLRSLLDLYEQKFVGHDSFFLLRSLVYFDDAEIEPDPLMIEPVSWAQVKETIRQETSALSRV